MACEWPVIFLDIDGVLNGHNFSTEAMSNVIERKQVQLLNWILRKTDARTVLSSAWRYMIHGGMSLQGFDYLLRTHGVIAGRLIGCTCTDETMWSTRGRQIASFRHRYVSPLARCVTIDDGDDDDTYGLKTCGVPWIRTDANHGLSLANAMDAIEMLGGSLG